LSYTDFKYEGLKLSASKVAADGSVMATVKVKNTGQRAGDEVVQLYVQHLGSAVQRPQLELKGFARVRIEAGAERDVMLELKPRDLAYWDVAGHVWRVEKEQVRVLAGGSSDNLPAQATMDVESSSEITPIQLKESVIGSVKETRPGNNSNPLAPVTTSLPEGIVAGASDRLTADTNTSKKRRRGCLVSAGRSQRQWL
jgi:hypothetical protein